DPALEISSATVHAQAKFDGRTSLDGSLEADLPAMRLRHRSTHLDIDAIHLKAAVKAHGKDVELALSDVRIGDLVSAGRAHLLTSLAKGASQFQAEIDSLELPRLRSAVLDIGGENPAVREYATRVRGGRLSDIRVSSQSEGLATLFDAANVSAGATMSDAAFLLPGVEIEAEEMAGRVEFAQGILRVHDAGARVGQSRMAGAKAEYAFGEGRGNAQAAFDLDLAASLEVVRRAMPRAQRESLSVIRSLRGRAQGTLSAELDGAQWRAEVDIAKSDSVLRVKPVPWPLSLRHAHLAISPDRLVLAKLAGSAGASTFSDVSADMVLGSRPRLNAARGHAIVSIDELFSWLRADERLAQSLRPVASIAGRVEIALDRLEGRLDRPAALAYDATLKPRALRAQLKGLPAFVLDGGSVRVTPDALALDDLGANALDAKGRVSGRVTSYQSGKPVVDARMEAAEIGAQAVDWVWQRFGLPERLKPATPLRATVQRVRWEEAGLDLAANLKAGAGPQVGIELGFKDRDLQIRKLAIKDAASDATARIAVRGRQVDVAFSGVLASNSLLAMLRNPRGNHPGKVRGDLSVAIDRDRPERTSAKGKLAGQDLHLDILLQLPIVVAHFDIEADGTALRVHELALEWAKQKATLRGRVELRPTGPFVDAEVDSPGIVVDALLPPRDEAAKQETGQQAEPESLIPWPLPVTGSIAVLADFLQYRRYRVEQVRATVGLDSQRAQLKVAQAALCGAALPLSIDAQPGQFDATLRMSVKDQDLGQVAQCLAAQGVPITGRFDLRLDVTTKGRTRELLRALTGPMTLHARNGEIRKFALLGNILALKSVGRLMKKGVNVGGEGFEYRDLQVRGHFDAGRFIVEEGLLDSDALGLAATGYIGLEDYHSRLTILVAPFGSVDRLVRKIPIVGYVLGGALTSVPVGVSGDIRSPLVVPLGPQAVTSNLTGIFERTLKLPARLFRAPAAAAPEDAVPEK
ncbi:MAG TPA: AsmA-like C-terminal region-containing protein, partial [Burkholderiales bacterium]|nr:AsmA-like C-terminal region-containing protein [Burkholderiales bacterium]